MRKFSRLITAAVAVFGSAAAIVAPSANAVSIPSTPTAICAAIGVPYPDFDHYLPEVTGRFSGEQYYGGDDELVWGASAPNSGLTCLQAARLGLKLAGLGFQELALDYNGQSLTGQPFFVIENEVELSPLGVQAMQSQARLWGLLYGIPRASAHMVECYCYGD